MTQPELESTDHEEPMSRERLDSPEVQEAIARARSRIGRGERGAGSTADDLLERARDERRMDSRT
jgi:hypothetical protein